MIEMKTLLNSIPQVGTVEWISIRPNRRGEIVVLDEVNVSVENGLEGDHYSNYSKKRQVTLIQKEHLSVVGSILGEDAIDPKLTRRNIVVKGINLISLKKQQFQIGEVILEGTGECHPCSRMEENFGAGGYNAMRGHGGLTAKVIQGGIIKNGDEVKLMLK
ncbi:MAG: MOSC domain-containing protein [Saprospiraceae bacterium]